MLDNDFENNIGNRAKNMDASGDVSVCTISTIFRDGPRDKSGAVRYIQNSNCSLMYKTRK